MTVCVVSDTYWFVLLQLESDMSMDKFMDTHMDCDSEMTLEMFMSADIDPDIATPPDSPQVRSS